MRIEEYKGYQITDEDIAFLIKEVEKEEELTVVDLYQNEIVKVFEDLVLNKYDQQSFIKLSLLSQRLLRNFDDVRIFELGLKISYNLIALGEKELKTSEDPLLEYRLSELYLILSYIIIDDGFNTIPYGSKAEKYNIDRDNNLALSYLQKASLYNPNNSLIKVSLGMYYYYKNNFYKAFDYLISAQSFYNGEWSYKQFVNIDDQSMIFTEIGIFFDDKKDEYYENGNKVFLCFKAAYLISQYADDLTKETFICTRYNMAYSYLKGIGVDENHKEGKKYLDELAEGLCEKYGEDISNIDDPDGIIKDYFK